MSPPADSGYSVAVTPPPFWSRTNLSASALGRFRQKRLIASCTSLAAPLSFSQSKNSSGLCVPALSSTLPSNSELASPSNRFAFGVEQEGVEVGLDPEPGLGPLQVERSASRRFDGDPEGASVCRRRPGSKSMQCVGARSSLHFESGGQPPESRNSGASQEAMSLPSPSIRLSLPAAEK